MTQRKHPDMAFAQGDRSGAVSFDLLDTAEGSHAAV
jgi:hypothetical protein